MKRKPHQEGLDPQNPGIPVSPQDLRTASKEYQRTQAKAVQQGPVQPGSLAGKAPVGEVPQNLTGVDGQQAAQRHMAAPPKPQQPPPSGDGQGPEPAIPATYSAGKAPGDEAEKHPLLEDLEHNFGIEKLKCQEVELGGYKWTFRPMSFEDYEWMANHVRRNVMTQEAAEPSMSVASVAAVLAAINDTPVYELFKVDATGRHIPDKLNPPPDIRYEAALYLLEWFREKVGMWELIGKLDEQVDILFEEQRSREYPLWATLASPYRQQIVELKQALDSSMEPDGKPGDDASQQQESSPQTQEPSSSGTTPKPSTSSSTGTTERSSAGLTG
ncbi:MAG: hypothetical protein GWN58_23400 [Anaerolineae bacterium]|nr:hypothetical protein [Anaerolineae bacterium]